MTRSGLPFGSAITSKGPSTPSTPAAMCKGGSGVIVLPCGAGKTIVGLAALAALQTETLVLTTSTTAVEQWRREILDKTDLARLARSTTYTGDSKEIGPVTLATYQIVTYRPKKDGDFPHFGLFNQRDWGLIIYDEVHLLPAPVFRITADIQARRRLGLTATLVREDHREEDVFSLIGPKKYDVPWRVLESKGWIAEAQCHEIRLGLPASLRMEYALAEWRDKFRLASENPVKEDLIELLLERHDGPDDRVLVIGQYLKQLRRIAERFDLPLITGATSNAEREDLYGRFRTGALRRLVLSKVGNFAIDLPDANVMIQVSGTFGSRQEEAQRLGRILRPKEGEKPACFYTLVTRDTREMDFAHHRQLFLTEQGYSYEIVDESELTTPDHGPLRRVNVIRPRESSPARRVSNRRETAPMSRASFPDSRQAAQERDPDPDVRAGARRGAAGPENPGSADPGAALATRSCWSSPTRPRPRSKSCAGWATRHGLSAKGKGLMAASPTSSSELRADPTFVSRRGKRGRAREPTARVPVGPRAVPDREAGGDRPGARPGERRGSAEHPGGRPHRAARFAPRGRPTQVAEPGHRCPRRP